MQARLVLGVSLILIGVLSACGGSPAATQPSLKSAAAPGTVLTGIRLDGPATLAPGASAQYRATALYGDGSGVDVTSQCKWSTTNDAILSVTSTAMATARSNGDAGITAAFGALSQARDVIVVPTGLFMLRVMATEDVQSAHLDNVRVAVVSGPAAGLATTTAWDGTATLFGVPQDAQISFSKDGYQTVVQSVHLDSNGGSILAQLIPTAGRVSLAGQYQLTIDGSACAADGAFPAAAKVRTYAASIQNSTDLALVVNLASANFAISTTCPNCGGEPTGSGFRGQTEAASARFTLTAYAAPQDWNDGVYPDVVERLGDGRFLTVSGKATVSPTASGFAGTLDGALAIFGDLVTGGSIGSQAVATCRSAALPFALARQTGAMK